MAYFRLLVFYFLINNVYGILPTDFDALMEKLFETPECESFVSDGTYLSVATSACSPYTCDSPRQLCMRESDKIDDETANQCRAVPEACLTAANDGVPLSPSGPSPTSPQQITAPTNIGGSLPPLPPLPPRPLNSGDFGDICEQTEPEGKFCGYQLKYTFNREMKNCVPFWFVGCATEKTNDNLFGDLQSCQIATQNCQKQPTQPSPTPTTTVVVTTTQPTTTLPPPPPPPPPQPPIKAFPDYPNSGEEIPPAPPPPPPAAGGLGGAGNVGGLVGQLLGGGLGGGSPQAGNFQGLIETLGAVAKPGGGGIPGAGGGAESLLTNFNPQQFTSLFSSFGRR